MLKHCHRLYLFRSFDRSFSFGSASSLCVNATSVRKWQGAGPCVSPLPPAENDDAQKSRSPLFLLMSLWNTPEIRRFCLYHDSFLWSCSPSPWIFIVNQKVLPFPSSLSTPYCAPCSSRMPLTMLSPMPDPSFARTCALCPL